MTDVPDRFREEAKEVAAQAHGAARDDKDARQDNLTAQLLNMFEHLQNEVVDHMRSEGRIIEKLSNSVVRLEEKADKFLAAFPDDDSKAHRQYHDLLISNMRDKKMLFNKLYFELGKYGLIGFAVWAIYALWKTFLLGPE